MEHSVAIDPQGLSGVTLRHLCLGKSFCYPIACCVRAGRWRYAARLAFWTNVTLARLIPALGELDAALPQPRVPVSRSSVFYAANHHSWIDIPVISGVTSLRLSPMTVLKAGPLIDLACKINNLRYSLPRTS
jgi:hypothetical protein